MKLKPFKVSNRTVSSYQKQLDSKCRLGTFGDARAEADKHGKFSLPHGPQSSSSYFFTCQSGRRADEKKKRTDSCCCDDQTVAPLLSFFLLRCPKEEEWVWCSPSVCRNGAIHVLDWRHPTKEGHCGLPKCLVCMTFEAQHAHKFAIT